jgi:hypothetical protein
VRFVRQAEAKLGRSLPLGYVARLCRQNGGEARVGREAFSLFPVLDTSDRKRLARTCNDIVRETEWARRWPAFPPGALAIADNGGGDKLVLLPAPDAPRFADAVYWWDHETGDLHLAADAFEDLT